MKRISECFARLRAHKKKALVAYLTGGAPDMETSERLIDAVLDNGADILELGVPFSDPTADGEIIRAAAQRALANGATLPKLLELARRVRARHPQTPLVLFSYYNPLYRYGVDALARACGDSGIDACLVVDLPREERDELAPALAAHGVATIALVAPTTPPARLQKILDGATGFVYYVMVRGVTGVRAHLPADLSAKLAAVKAATALPVVAGFGVADASAAREAAALADGVVVGSAFMRAVDAAPTYQVGIENAAALARSISAAL